MHPNAAKLWMEFLYSDEGQIIWMKGYCHPIREGDMRERGRRRGPHRAAGPPVHPPQSRERQGRHPLRGAGRHGARPGVL